jgi:lysozyme family protein
VTRDEAAGEVIATVMANEGGIKDVGDGKGVTRFGQTPDWLRSFGFEAPTGAHEAIANYRTWLVRTRLIGLCDYPDGLSVGVVDWAVHSGHITATRELQRLLGVKPDGTYGPETQAAVDGCDRLKVARQVIGRRLRFIGRLVTDNPERNARYAAGWNARLADQVERLV